MEILFKKDGSGSNRNDIDFLFSFAIVYFAPGDISDMYVNPEMTEEQKANVIAQLGLDKSMTEQYFAWAKRAVHGDLGVSLSNKSAVWPQFMQRLPATIILMGSSMILSLLLAIPLGLWSGYKKNSWLDNLISSLAYMGMSIPSFWFGMLLIIVFAAVLKVLPSSGMHTVGNVSAFDTFQHMILPCITLSIGHVAVYIRYIRANTIGQLSEEYVLTAEAKGDSQTKILFRHVLKNTLLPIITLIGNESGIFGMWILYCRKCLWMAGNWNLCDVCDWFKGLSGNHGVCYAFWFSLVVGNFIADLLYAFVDPRIKRGGASGGK